MLAFKKRSLELVQGVTRSYISGMKRQIESALSDLTSKGLRLRLGKEIEYALLSSGKRLRPLMVILSAQSVGGNWKDTMSLALAIEMLHTATLVHDDIIDQDKLRRGLPAVHEKWSIDEAILVGDALISSSIFLAADYGKKILKITAETGLKLCDGEYLDMSTTSIEMSENEYLEKIDKKSACLFQTATEVGAIAGGGAELEVRSLADFGYHFGMAYQLSDDLSDIVPLTDGVPRDLRKRRITLPLIHLYKSSASTVRESLLGDLAILAGEKHGDKNSALDTIVHRLKADGSLDYCEKKKNEFVNKSITDLKSIRDTEYKSHLMQMAELLK